MNRAGGFNLADCSKQLFLLLLYMAVASLFNACGFPGGAPDSHETRGPALEQIPPDRLPVFEDDLAFDKLAEGIQASISYFRRLPPGRIVSFGTDRYSAGHMICSLKNFSAFIRTHPATADLQAYISKNFRVYAYVEKNQPVQALFTGYYEPLLYGSLTKTERYRFPVYSRPSDLVTFNPSAFNGACPDKKFIGKYTGGSVVPYDSRRDIEKPGAMTGRAAPIAWVDDRVDLFFLQIQGSGKIRLGNGETIRVHYDISNGHPYRSIGRYLIDHGKIGKGQVSMQSIRAYLAAHPKQVRGILNYNPRYVFFKIVDNGLSGGPMGSLDVGLVPGRSIATDQRIFPAGALAFIQTRKPVVDDAGRIASWTGFSRFMLNQDTGSAIRGPGRADIFWGSGEYAELAAGHMKQPGMLYFLVLNPQPAQ